MAKKETTKKKTTKKTAHKTKSVSCGSSRVHSVSPKSADVDGNMNFTPTELLRHIAACQEAYRRTQLLDLRTVKKGLPLVVLRRSRGEVVVLTWPNLNAAGEPS